MRFRLGWSGVLRFGGGPRLRGVLRRSIGSGRNGRCVLWLRRGMRANRSKRSRFASLGGGRSLLQRHDGKIDVRPAELDAPSPSAVWFRMPAKVLENVVFEAEPDP